MIHQTRRRFRLAFAALVCAVVPSLAACGGGPSTEAAPSSPAMYGGFCVPEKYRAAYINAPDDGGASKAIEIAASNMISMAAIRGRDGKCWMLLTEDPCFTQTLFDRVVAAPKSSRPQMIRELEADLRYYDRYAVYYRVDENCFIRREEHGGDHATIPDTGGARPEVQGSVGGSSAPAPSSTAPSGPTGPWVVPPGATWNGPPSADRGSADAGGTDDLEDDPRVPPSRAEGP